MKRILKKTILLFTIRHKVFENFNDLAISIKTEQDLLFFELFKIKYKKLFFIKLNKDNFIIGDLNKNSFISHKTPCLYFSYVFNITNENNLKINNKHLSHFLIKNNINILEKNIKNIKTLLPTMRTLGYNPSQPWISGKTKYNMERDQKKYNFELLTFKKDEEGFRKIIACKQLRYEVNQDRINLWQIVFNSTLSEIYYTESDIDFKFCWFLNLQDRKILFQLGTSNGIGAIDYLYFNLKNQNTLIDFAQGDSVYKTKLSNCVIDNYSFYI